MMDNNSFASIDKLMEFGLGIGIAQQMVNTMNHVIDTMYMPNAGQAIKPLQMGYYAIIANQQIGPLCDEELSQLVENNSLTKDTFLWKPGMSGWKLAKDIPEVFKHIILNRR